jgi:hypothetical protein
MQVRAPHPTLPSRTLFLTNPPSFLAYSGFQQANATVYGYFVIVKCNLALSSCLSYQASQRTMACNKQMLQCIWLLFYPEMYSFFLQWLI